MTRKCTANGWFPLFDEIECKDSIDEYTIRTPCPPDYQTLAGVLENIQFCVRILPEQPWENVCASSGSSFTLDKTAGASSVIGQMRTEVGYSSKVFWMPARKLWYGTLGDIELITGVEIDYGVQWTLPGTHGQSMDLTVGNYANGDGCIGGQIGFKDPEFPIIEEYLSNTLADCTESYPIICLYDLKQPTMLQLSCPYGYKTTRYAHYQHVCIKIHKFENPIERDALSDDDYVREHICENVFQIDTGYALYIFEELSRQEQLNESDRCLFRIVPDRVIITEKQWTELVKTEKIEFINWSFDVSIPDAPGDENILVAKHNGEWMWDKRPVTCAICFIPNEIRQPSLSLDKDDDGNLVLAVQNYKFLWKDNDLSNGLSCFSFTYQAKLIESVEFYPIESENEMERRFKLFAHGIGKYWCTGVHMGTFDESEASMMWNVSMKFAVTARRLVVSSEPIEDVFQSFLTRLLNLTLFRIDRTTLEHSSSSQSSGFTETIDLFHLTVTAITDYYLKFEKNAIGLNEPMLVAYYIKHCLDEIRLTTTPATDFHILSLNSTDFCLPASISKLESDKRNWSGVRIGQYVPSIEFCLQETNGLPATKKCIGDGLRGGVWKESFENTVCNNNLRSPMTLELHNLNRLDMNAKGIIRIIDQLDGLISLSNYTNLIAADIFYISQIMYSVQYSISTCPLRHDDVVTILGIYNRLLMVAREVMYMSSPLNTTNVLLYAADVIVADFATTNDNPSNNGILSFQFDEPMLTTFIFHSKLTDLTGIVATNRTTNRTSHITIEMLNKYQKIEEIMNTTDLVIASYIPDPLWQQLQKPVIIVSLFINDILFHSYNPNGDASNAAKKHINSSGSILSIVLPGTVGNLPEKLPIFIKPEQRNNNDTNVDACGFWSFSPTINGWASDGCSMNRKLTNADVILCECIHLTNFAYLFYGRTPIDIRHFDKLQLITFIACSVSLAGLCGIYLSAMLFQSWRSTLSTKFLLQISSSITLELLIILFVNTETNVGTFIATKKSSACIALGAMLHYSVLVTFLWMFIIGYMQYRRYVVVFQKPDSNNLLLISSLIGWCGPMIPVAVVLFVDCQSYIPTTTTGNYAICYPSGYSLYLGLMTPIVILTAANLTIFVLVIKSITNNPAGGRDSRAMTLSKLRLSIFLFFLLGLTWISSFFSATNAGLVFTYLFCATATLQGFILFFYFVILDPTVRGLWVKFSRALCCCKTVN